MPEIRVQEQIRVLASPNPAERLRAAASLGRLGASVREADGTLSADYRSAVISLAEALRDRESPLIRAEAAWALGRIGGLGAVRRLLPRIEEVYPAPQAGSQTLGGKAPAQEGSTNDTAALIAAVGKSCSEDVLANLDEDDLARLRQIRELLLGQLATETNDDVRVAVVETLVALSVRGRRAGIDFPTDLSPLLCRGGRDAVFAAIALLRETAPDARRIATRWHQRSGAQAPDEAVGALMAAWEQDLGPCRPERARLLEWLDTAAILWDLREAAELIV